MGCCWCTVGEWSRGLSRRQSAWADAKLIADLGGTRLLGRFRRTFLEPVTVRVVGEGLDMVKKRIKIPDDLAAQIMFAADRTCCVCRESTRKTKIHHVDDDPSNNSFENLAVLCDDCHSDAHTTHAFARNLSPQLIAEYSTSWRAIVSARLKYQPEPAALHEYAIEALLDVSLAPHHWKNQYLALYPGHFQQTDFEGGDVWDLLESEGKHTYSGEQWQKYLPLFTNSITEVVGRLERLLLLHSTVIPVGVKLAILRANRSLRTEQSSYRMLPTIADHVPDVDVFFGHRFKSVVETLATLARKVDSVGASIQKAN